MIISKRYDYQNFTINTTTYSELISWLIFIFLSLPFSTALLSAGFILIILIFYVMPENDEKIILYEKSVPCD